MMHLLDYLFAMQLSPKLEEVPHKPYQKAIDGCIYLQIWQKIPVTHAAKAVVTSQYKQSMARKSFALSNHNSIWSIRFLQRRTFSHKYAPSCICIASSSPVVIDWVLADNSAYIPPRKNDAFHQICISFYRHSLLKWMEKMDYVRHFDCQI